MHKFLVIIEKTENNFSAYSPDLPGCVAAGKTRNETEVRMFKAIGMHIDGLKEDNLVIPRSHSYAEYVAVA